MNDCSFCIKLGQRDLFYIRVAVCSGRSSAQGSRHVVADLWGLRCSLGVWLHTSTLTPPLSTVSCSDDSAQA